MLKAAKIKMKYRCTGVIINLSLSFTRLKSYPKQYCSLVLFKLASSIACYVISSELASCNKHCKIKLR